MHRHNGWSESEIREAIRRTTPRVRDILAYVAGHPGCTSADIAAELGFKGPRSVGPTLNALTKTAEAMGVNDDGVVHWFFEHPGKVGGWWRYDFPNWVRQVVMDELGVR